MPVGLRLLPPPPTFPALTVQVAFASKPLDNPQVWTDVTKYARRLSIRRGRQHVLAQFEPGRMQLVMDGRDGALDPTNTSSPYSPNVDINKRIRVLASLNLLTAAQANLETGITGWAAGPTYGANTTLAQSSTWATSGTNSLALTATASGGLDATTPTGTAGLAVYPGVTYTGLAQFHAGAAGRTVTLLINWYTAAGALISSTSASVTDTTSTVSASVTGVAPSNAATAALEWTVTGCAAGEVHYGDQFSLAPGTSLVWYPGGSFPLFTGFVEAWQPLWPDNANADIQVTASDALRLFATNRMTKNTYASTVLADGATGLWRMNDPIGQNTVADSGPNHYDGSFRGAQGSLVTPGQQGPCYADAGTAISFTNWSWCNVPAAANVTAGSWTVEAWFQTTNNDPVQIHRIYEYQDATLDFLISSTGQGGLYLRALINGSQVMAKGVDPPVSFLDGKWHHLIVTTSDRINFKIYGDNVLMGTATSTATVIMTSAGSASWGDPVIGTLTLANCAVYNGIVLSPATIATHFALGGAGFVVQDSGARLTAVLAAMGWQTTEQSIAVGNATIQQPTGYLTGSSQLSYMQSVAKTEYGLFYVDASGIVTFRNRGYLLSPPGNVNQATFGDALTGELPYRPSPGFARDNIDLYNLATAQRTGGVLQSSQDAVSMSTYGISNVLAESGLLSISDYDSLARTQWNVAHFAYPRTRIRAITMDVLGDLASRFPVAAQQDLGARVTVNRRPPNAALFSQPSIIEGISHEIDVKGKWTVTYALSPAETQQYWVLGDTVNGVLGSTTRLAY